MSETESGESQEKEQELPYIINEITTEVDGEEVPVRQVVLRNGGKVVFAVPPSFDDAQIGVVFGIANIYFNNGMSKGTLAAQANFRTAIGLVEKPTQPVK